MSRNTFIWITIGIAIAVVVAIGEVCLENENVAQADEYEEKNELARRDSIIAHIAESVDSLKMGQEAIEEQNESILSIERRSLRIDSANYKEIRRLRREVKRLQNQEQK